MEIRIDIKGYVDKRAKELAEEWSKKPIGSTARSYESFRTDALIEYLEKVERNNRTFYGRR